MPSIFDTREGDARDLEMLEAYAAGIPVVRIAAAHDASYSTVKRRIAAIRDADIRHDPEALRYWAGIQRRPR